MKTVEVTEPQAIFVVAMREILVARDIEFVIRDIWPDACIVVTRTLEEAFDASPAGRIRAAFVQTDAANFVASTLGRRVAADGGRVVLAGKEKAHGLPEGWKALPFPFFDNDVESLLADVP